MRIAIPTDGNCVSAHFGRCPEFTLVDIDNNEIQGRQRIKNPGHVPGFLPKFLKDNQTDCIVSGGMGVRARELFAQQEIDVVLGVDGEIEDVIVRFTQGRLESGESFCQPGQGKGYGIDKSECTHSEDGHPHHQGGNCS